MSRFSIVFCALLGTLIPLSGARAQTVLEDPQPAPVVVANPAILSVGLPPSARLRFDLDAQDEDVLGVVKSLLKGFNGSNFKEMLRSPAPIPSGAPASPSGETAMMQMLSDADLGTMLKDVHHLRVVAFETTNNYNNRRAQIASAQSVLNYYSAAYLTREGGRRVLRADMDDVQMLGVSFPDKGFAVVMSGPGFGFVMRGDGYPNLESVGPLAMTAMLFGIRATSPRAMMIP